jgi:hypothetical protein
VRRLIAICAISMLIAPMARAQTATELCVAAGKQAPGPERDKFLSEHCQRPTPSHTAIRLTAKPSPPPTLRHLAERPSAAPAPAVVPAPAAVSTPAAALAVHQIRIPKGTEVHFHFNDELSSATASPGDIISLTDDVPITLFDGTVIAAGYRGEGDVTVAQRRDAMGQAGKLSVRLDYLHIGDANVRLRGSKVEEGKSGGMSSTYLTIFTPLGPLGAVKPGSDGVIQKGQTLTGYVDEEAVITLPIAPPPPND